MTEPEIRRTLSESGARQLANATETMVQQRMWIEELQEGCDLLMKQLDFSQAIARTTDPAFAMNHALGLVLEVVGAPKSPKRH